MCREYAGVALAFDKAITAHLAMAATEDRAMAFAAGYAMAELYREVELAEGSSLQNPDMQTLKAIVRTAVEIRKRSRLA